MANIYRNWKFRADITVTNPSSTEGFQAKFTLAWLPGMRGDFRDIRFADKFGQPLPYYIESKTDFLTAEVWVKLPANDKKIKLYYGNGAVVSESSANDVFDFYDDFSADSTSSYTHAATKASGFPIFSISAGVLTAGRGVSQYGQDSWYQALTLNGTYTLVVKCNGITGDHTDKRRVGLSSSPSPGSNWGDLPTFEQSTCWRGDTNGVGVAEIDYISTISGSTNICIFNYDPSSVAAYSYNLDYIYLKKYEVAEPTLTLSRKQQGLKYVGFLFSTGPETSFTLPCTGISLGPATPRMRGDFPVPPTAGISIGPASKTIQEALILPCSGLTLQGGYSPLRDTISLPCSGIVLSPDTHWFQDYTGLDLFEVISVDISRTISDSMWQLSSQISGSLAPAEFKNVNWSATDHIGTSQHLFAGVITEARRSYACAGDGIDITAYDYGWYLSAQKIPLDMLVMDLDGSRNSWDDWVEDLLENTGVVPYKINHCSIDGKQISFNPTQTKMEAIQKICEYTGYIFYVCPVNTGTDDAPVWRAGAYFLDENDIDDEEDGLDLPAPAVITWPDPTLVGIPSVAGKSEERINRVTVRGCDDDGIWYTAIEESPNVTSGDAYPREYYEESSNWNTQAKCDARAQRIYAYFNIGATAVSATFIKRFDLRLWQMISFSGAGFGTFLTTLPPLRIVSIRYSQADADETVTITAIPDRDMNLLQLGTSVVDEDSISTTESIVEHELAKVQSPVIGTVISIDGNIATVETEDGKIIKVRVVS